MNNRELEIPEIFYSFDTGQPFNRCIECDRNLADGSIDYFVEKIYRNYPEHQVQDVIIDYAICIDCAHRFHQKLSLESQRNIQHYISGQMMNRPVSDEASVDELISSCLIKKKPIGETEEFQIFAHCRGNKLLMDIPPYMICWEAMNEITELLSDSTKDEMGGFFNKHFTPDPDLFKNPTQPKLVLI